MLTKPVVPPPVRKARWRKAPCTSADIRGRPGRCASAVRYGRSSRRCGVCGWRSAGPGARRGSAADWPGAIGSPNRLPAARNWQASNSWFLMTRTTFCTSDSLSRRPVSASIGLARSMSITSAPICSLSLPTFTTPQAQIRRDDVPAGRWAFPWVGMLLRPSEVTEAAVPCRPSLGPRVWRSWRRRSQYSRQPVMAGHLPSRKEQPGSIRAQPLIPRRALRFFRS